MQAVKKIRTYNQEPPHKISTVSNVPDLSSDHISITSIQQSPAVSEVHARKNKKVHYGKAYSPDGPHGGYDGL